MANFRLDEERSKALSAAGVPNASRVDEAIEGAEGPIVTYQGTIQVDDLTHLSPVSFSPNYIIGGNQSTPPAGEFATLEMVCPVPWVIHRIEPIAATHQIGVVDVPIAFTGLVTPFVFHPNEDVAPRQMVVRNGATLTNLAGLFIEANRNFEMGTVVPPGVIVVLQASSAATSAFPNVVVQEFPGGATRPQT